MSCRRTIASFLSISFLSFSLTLVRFRTVFSLKCVCYIHHSVLLYIFFALNGSLREGRVGGKTVVKVAGSIRVSGVFESQSVTTSLWRTKSFSPADHLWYFAALILGTRCFVRKKLTNTRNQCSGRTYVLSLHRPGKEVGTKEKVRRASRPCSPEMNTDRRWRRAYSQFPTKRWCETHRRKRSRSRANGFYRVSPRIDVSRFLSNAPHRRKTDPPSFSRGRNGDVSERRWDGTNPDHEISRSRENTSASRHEARLRNLNSLISIFSSYYPPFKGEPRITDSEVIGLRERDRDNNAVVSIVYFLFFFFLPLHL